jgi:hypothetical protein
MKTLNYRKVFAVYLAVLGGITIASLLLSIRNINDLFASFGLEQGDYLQLNLIRVVTFVLGVLYLLAGFFVWHRKQIDEILIGFRVSAISEVLLWVIAALPGFIALYFAIWGQVNKLISYA